MTDRLSFATLLLSMSLTTSFAFAQDVGPTSASTGVPANLCQELVAFVKKPEEKKQEAATPASQSTAVSNPSGKTEGQPSSSGGAPQQTSGLSGPVNADTKAPTSDTRAPVNDGRTTLAQANAAAKLPPAPRASPPSPKPDEALIARIEAAASANDQLDCRAAVRTMRAAGVVMPPPLLALAALNPKFYPRTQP